MALLATQDITQTGTTPTYASANASGDSMVADGRTFLHVKNASGGAITVTITAAVSSLNQSGFGDIPISNIAVSVPATTGDKLIAVPPASHAPGGIATITYSGVTSLTVAAIRAPRI